MIGEALLRFKLILFLKLNLLTVALIEDFLIKF